MECLICKEHIPLNHCCMLMKVGGKNYLFHMGCEQELTKLRTAVFMILAEWDGIWYKYDRLIEALKESYSLTASKKETKEALQFLIKIGEIHYGPLVNHDYVPCGAGYTWKHGMGV